MFEYLKAKQPDIPKRGMFHSVVQQRSIPDRNGYTDRFAKPGYYPTHEMGSVVQMERCKNCGAGYFSCHCDNYEPANTTDRAFRMRSSSYLDSHELRRALLARSGEGEAHHVFSANVVRDKGLDYGVSKGRFNEAWNGILLNGMRIDREHIEHPLRNDTPKIMHRDTGKLCHTGYDDKLKAYIDKMNIHTIGDCIKHVDKIKEAIMQSKADCLDKITFPQGSGG